VEKSVPSQLIFAPTLLISRVSFPTGTGFCPIKEIVEDRKVKISGRSIFVLMV
jgi:hypothetical protein